MSFEMRSYGKHLRVCAVLALLASTPAFAQSNVSFDLPAQPLAKSLRAVANQSSTNVLFDQKLVAGIKAPALKAQLTPREAIARLLAGTGVVYEFVNEHTVVLASSHETLQSRKATVEQTSRVAPEANMQLAQAGLPPEQPRAQAAQASAAVEVDEKGIPEMLIRGRRTSNADIQRTEDDIQPYVVFDAGQIERSGAANLEDFLKTRLPMNSVQATSAQQVGGFFGNQSQVNLRGLGTNQTLILVNGRRMPSLSGVSITTTGFVQPDVNGIPMSSVARIEVLPSTASGIYGGGATGGVVNIILKRDYSGVEAKGTYDNTFDSDFAQRKLDASAGFSLEGGRTNIQLSASYSDSNRLLAGERDFSDRAVALQRYNNPDVLTAFFTPPRGRTPNIANAFGGPLVYRASGISLGEAVTYVPEGYQGVHTDGGAALAIHAGEYNYEMADDVVGRYMSLLSDPVVESFAASIRREFGSRVEGFLDLKAYDNKSRASIAGLPSFVTLEPGTPNNPFTDPINVNFPSPGIERAARSDSGTRQAAGGLIVRLPMGWTAHTEYSWSRSRFESTSFNQMINAQGMDALYSGVLDVVRDVNLYPLDYSPYAFERPTSIYGPADTLLQDATVRMAGRTFDLPGGPLNLSALLEYRKEEAKPFIRESNFSGTTPTYTFQPSRVQNVKSAYLEATAPLVSDRNAMPFVQALELQLSVRRDEYETTIPATSGINIPSRTSPIPAVGGIVNEVQSTDYTVGLRYSPVRDVALRASYGTGFLPPSISQLFPSFAPRGAVFAADPKRENVRTGIFPVEITRGGNPDLTPEFSTSWSVGAVFTPSALKGLRLSVDYTRIRKDDEIGTFLFQEIFDNEDSLPGRIVRAPLTQADRDAGYTGGVVLAVNSTSANISETGLEAFDIQLDYTWDSALGHANFYALTSYQPHLKRRMLPASALVDRAGFLDGPVKWRGNTGMTLERDHWTFGWNMQFYDAYLVYESFTPGVAIPDLVLSQGSPTVPSQQYHDLYARYRFGQAPLLLQGFLSDVELMLSVQNVLDTTPPIIASGVADSGYSLYADPRLRRYSLSLLKRF